ncbi:thyrotropin-releasing hormone receptor [Plakobranchus ocellatus]|uniref:Thyrotropin-releasing hormone receptor n=1 Tax=Plakobranchus ocellatus TaxID=259542 RepID=A0AAV3Y462_9GAST|nr:thyrotropin-releasing hormone receptor [Plakobranchus ocellatus]
MPPEEIVDNTRTNDVTRNSYSEKLNQASTKKGRKQSLQQFYSHAEKRKQNKSEKGKLGEVLQQSPRAEIRRSLVGRINKHFTRGEPVLLAIGALGNVILVTVFLITPLRVRVVSHTLAAAGICDLLYTVGCLLLYMSSRGIRVLALPGTCQVLTFVLILSHVMATWCLFFSHLHRLNAHTKTGHEGRKHRVCKAKFSIMLLALLTVAVTVHYLWTMDRVTINGRVYCAPMREVVSAHLLLRKMELVIGILLPMMLIAGIDLLLLLKLVVHIIVIHWDREEDEEGVEFLGSSTFGTHKIVKMPLCPQNKEMEKEPTSWNNSAIELDNKLDKERTPESSVESHKRIPIVLLAHSVLIEEKDMASNEAQKVCRERKEDSLEDNEGLQQSQQLVRGDSREAAKRFIALASSQNEETHRETFFDSEVYSKNTLTFQSFVSAEINSSEHKINKPHLERRVSVFPFVKEATACEKNKDIFVNSFVPQSKLDINLEETTQHSFIMQSSNNTTENRYSVTPPSANASQTDANSRSLSGVGKRRISTIKAVFTNISAKKSKRTGTKKVGFLGEVSGDRTRSDNANKKKRRTYFFSHSGSNVTSKSSNSKVFSSYASYKSIDSTASRGSNRTPEDHEFPEDSTSCTVATVLMGVFLAIFVLPATFQHAIRMFGSPASSQPSFKEMETAVFLENFVKFAVVYKFFICLFTMNSFRQGLVWLLRYCVCGIIKSSSCCYRCEDNDTDGANNV